MKNVDILAPEIWFAASVSVFYSFLVGGIYLFICLAMTG